MGLELLLLIMISMEHLTVNCYYHLYTVYTRYIQLSSKSIKKGTGNSYQFLIYIFRINFSQERAAKQLSFQNDSGFFRKCPGKPGICNIQCQIQAVFLTGFYNLLTVADGGVRIHQLYRYLISDLQILYFLFTFNYYLHIFL